MLDFSLLKSPSFILLLLNAGFTSIGYYTPYMFTKDRAVQKNIPEESAFWLISTIGITNTLGRVACGILVSFPQIKATWISFICLTAGGLATILSALSDDLRYQFMCSALFGLSVGKTLTRFAKLIQ